LNTDENFAKRNYKLTILQTTEGKTLTKRFEKVFNRTNNPKVKWGNYYRPYEIYRDDIEEVSKELTKLEPRSDCIVVLDELNDKSKIGKVVRRKSGVDFHEHEEGRNLICIDIDDIPSPPDLKTEDQRREFLLSLLPENFQKTSHHFQWSSSAGVECPLNDELNGWDFLSIHFWFCLAEPRTKHDLKHWAKSNNLPIDSSQFNAVQPHFTATPIFSKNVVDPVQQRSGFVKGQQGVVYIDKAPQHENKSEFDPYNEQTWDWGDQVSDRLVGTATQEQVRNALKAISESGQTPSDDATRLATLVQVAKTEIHKRSDR